MSTFTDGESACLNWGCCAGGWLQPARTAPRASPPFGELHDPGHEPPVIGGHAGTTLAASKKFMLERDGIQGGCLCFRSRSFWAAPAPGAG
jgi:hypothetical protein